MESYLKTQREDIFEHVGAQPSEIEDDMQKFEECASCEACRLI